MKTIQFTPHHTGAYGCSEPGENYGEYVRADVTRDLLAALKVAREAIDYRVTSEALAQIDAAIAKAEGRQP